ncbi:relaxase/mobilization nuclease domain-containing protein [Agrobacterium tumefaciens]|uniref:relaxase/mobilization nuclease domain-containing protein n=1 Tax=Agrobacterium tumefaciens TaxID=358 RepID=UPI0022067E1D|nr:relaxase/mobilization nuclease domain-containing protein [Agrobacterium tumefaciens]
MVPDVAGTGHSFKGALAYYLHDKRANDALPQLSSSERVAWTETRNLATDDMHTAQRVMIATAKQADELKARAGKKAGRKATSGPVYAYSLSWRPDEAATLTRDEMVRAADASLKVLGAENRQAVIVCHTDRKHPHVHVVVNRVDPEDGRMLVACNDHRKLSDWANEYERERGRILTPRREEKRVQRERNADKAERRKYTEQKRAAAKEQAHDTKSRATILRELGASQKVQHRGQWRDLAAREKADRNEIYRLSGVAIAATIEQHKAECKPIWAEHYRGKRAAERRFNQREKSMSGVVVNAFVAARHQQATGQLEGRGLLTATVANVFSSRARQQAFEQAQEMTRQQLASRLKSIVDNEISNLKEQRGRDLAKHRDLFKAERGALIDRQDGERAKLREAWQQLYGDRSEWSPQGSERGTKPYRAETRRDDQQRPAAAFDRKAAYRAYQQKGAGRMAENGENIVRAKDDDYRQKEHDNQQKLTTENRSVMQEGISRSQSAAQTNAAERQGAWTAKVSAVDAQHRQVVSAAEKAQQQPVDRKAAYLAVRPADAPDPQKSEPKTPRVVGSRRAAVDAERQQRDARKVENDTRPTPSRDERFDR